MDLFVFPSATDTFGNVVLEAMASGVPAIVSSGGGPKFIVQDGVSGFVARTLDDYAACAALLSTNCELRKQMSAEARNRACSFSWDAVFNHVYRVYEEYVARDVVATGLKANGHAAVMCDG
jgi:glycosyltransferase involved in cell wall biosynthesis